MGRRRRRARPAVRRAHPPPARRSSPTASAPTRSTSSPPTAMVHGATRRRRRAPGPHDLRVRGQRHGLPGHRALRRPRPPAPPAARSRRRARSTTAARRCSSTSARTATAKGVLRRRGRARAVPAKVTAVPLAAGRRLRTLTGTRRRSWPSSPAPPATTTLRVDRAASRPASAWPTRCGRCSPTASTSLVEPTASATPADAAGAGVPRRALAAPSCSPPTSPSADVDDERLLTLFAELLDEAGGVDAAAPARARGLRRLPRPHRRRLRGRRPVRPHRAHRRRARRRSIDAIIFALYGSVPRYDDRRLVAPAISQGADRGPGAARLRRRRRRATPRCGSCGAPRRGPPPRRPGSRRPTARCWRAPPTSSAPRSRSCSA